MMGTFRKPHSSSRHRDGFAIPLVLRLLILASFALVALLPLADAQMRVKLVKRKLKPLKYFTKIEAAMKRRRAARRLRYNLRATSSAA